MLRFLEVCALLQPSIFTMQVCGSVSALISNETFLHITSLKHKIKQFQHKTRKKLSYIKQCLTKHHKHEDFVSVSTSSLYVV